MAERLSTGLVQALNVTNCIKTVMANSVIYVYSGTQPATADDTEGSAVLLMKYTLNAGTFTSGVSTNGLNLDVSVAGVISKAIGEVWAGVGLAAAGVSPGTQAGWFRWYANTVVQGASTSAVRMDGAIGTTTSYEMRMSNTMIVEGGTSTFQSATYTTPKS